MNDSEFIVLADKALKRIESALDACDAGFDFALTGDGVLEIELADDSKIIVNRHGAAKEIWVAARAGGFHFRWDGQLWRDTKSGRELMAALSELISAQGGECMVLR